MTCAFCKSRREAIRYAYKSLNTGYAITPGFRLIGLYIGPHGRWHAIRFHFWNFYVWFSFKWKPIHKGKASAEKWQQ